MSYAYNTDAVCPTCQANPGEQCRSKHNKATQPHEARKRRVQSMREAQSARITYASPAARREHHDVAQDSWFPRKVEGPSPLCRWEEWTDVSLNERTDDARRYVRNAAFGMSDDTIEPVAIVRDLLAVIDDERGVGTATGRELEDERAAAEADRDEAQAKLTQMERERDDAERDRDAARKLAEHWEREAIAARDARDELKLQLRAPVVQDPDMARMRARLAEVRRDLEAFKADLDVFVTSLAQL